MLALEWMKSSVSRRATPQRKGNKQKKELVNWAGFYCWLRKNHDKDVYKPADAEYINH